MLDVETLRVVVAAVSLVVLVLFYVGVYRPTRSKFAYWWSISLVLAVVTPVLLLWNGTSWQVIANPASNVLSAIGCTFVWFATRAQRGLKQPWWAALATAGAVGLASALGDPANSVWAGNAVMFTCMGVMFLLAAWDMWMAWQDRRRNGLGVYDGEARMALLVSAIAASGLGGFYSLRTVLFMVDGPDSDAFNAIAGAGTTTVILMLCLVAVTFSIAALGYDVQTQELRRRVTHDDLTGIFGRAAFLDNLASAAGAGGPAPAFLVVADLDHFKAINDAHGHAAGDEALISFADACRRLVRAGEFVGRMGGEEFALVLRGPDSTAVEQRLHELSAEMRRRDRNTEVPLPTVSFGVTHLDDGPVGDAMIRADLALYRAKDGGRDQIAFSRAQSAEC